VSIRHNIRIRRWGGLRRWASWSPPAVRGDARAPHTDQTPAEARDAAIFAVLYIGGIQRAELAGLDEADGTPDPPTLHVRHGKGDKERLVQPVGAAAQALDAWLRVRGDRPGGLFLAITRHHTIVGTGMTSHAVYNILAKRQREAGVAKLSPTTSAAPSSATCWTLGSTSAPCNSSPGTPAWRRPRGRGAPLRLPARSGVNCGGSARSRVFWALGILVQSARDKCYRQKFSKEDVKKY